MKLTNKLKQFLTTPLNRLSLKIEGSPLETHIKRLYRELDKHEIMFKPACYLSDEWGCPHQIPLIAIPFYLADAKLSNYEKRFTGVPAETNKEIMMYLRHEAGHAFNYGYKLYKTKEWQTLFGLFERPYTENYKRKPYDQAFVKHLPDYYAQKHPDEDFAETFAVWLTPKSNWRKKYKATPAAKKLEYVSRIVKKFGGRPPLKASVKPDYPIESIRMTLKEWYRENSNKSKKSSTM